MFQQSDMTLAEQALYAAASQGVECSWGTASPTRPNLAEVQSWGPSRTVRAEMLRALLTDETINLHSSGVQLSGARIEGFLDLSAVTLRAPLIMRRCFFAASGEERSFINMIACTASIIEISSSYLPAVNASGLTVTTYLNLNQSVIKGAVNLQSAQIAKQLAFTGLEIATTTDSTLALNADRLVVDGDAYLERCLVPTGGVRFNGAHISGNVYAPQMLLQGQDQTGTALNGENLRVDGVLVLNELTATTGAVRLAGARVLGQFQCNASSVSGVDCDGYSLVADELVVGSSLMASRLIASGPVRLPSAVIGRQLILSGAHIKGFAPDGFSLELTDCSVGFGLFLEHDFRVEGSINLRGMMVGRTLRLATATIENAKEVAVSVDMSNISIRHDLVLQNTVCGGAVALDSAAIGGNLCLRASSIAQTLASRGTFCAARTRVEGDVDLGPDLTLEGRLILRGALVGGDLRCTAARVGAALGKLAFDAKAIEVSGDVHFDGHFSTAGNVDLSRGQVRGSLVVEAAQFGDFAARGLVVEDSLVWRPRSRPTTTVDLTRAKFGNINDDGDHPEANWPQDGRLHLDQLTYAYFEGDAPGTAASRLRWLRQQYGDAVPAGRFSTHPYEQLTAVYRAQGDEKSAREVAIARRNDARRFGTLSHAERFRSKVSDLTIGHGFDPFRTISALVVIYLAMTFTYWCAQQESGSLTNERVNIIVAATGDSAVTAQFRNARFASGEYPSFYPALYALDNVVPILSLRQSETWRINASAPHGLLVSILNIAASVAGWLLSTIAVLGLTGLIRKY